MKRLISSCIFLFCIYSSVQSAHVLGGNMTYRTLEINDETIRLEIRLVAYRDANGSGAPLDEVVSLGVYKANGANWDLFQELSSIPYFEITEHNLGNLPFVIEDNIPQFESAIYIAEITLPRDTNSDFLFAYQRCCRIDNLSNILNPGETGFAIQLVVTDAALQLENDSPQLYDISPSTAVIGVNNTYDLPIADSENDELSFSFCAPLSAGGTDGATGNGNPNGCTGVIPDPSSCPPPYDALEFVSPGFSAELPFGSANEMDLDPNTGSLTGTFNLAGAFNYGICIEEKRDGHVLSKVIIDHSIFSGIFEVVAIIRSRAYYDLNQNGIKEDAEEFLNHVSLTLDSPALKKEVLKNNTHQFFVGLGNYTIGVEENSPWKITNNTAVSIDALGSYYEVNVGLYPDVLQQSINVNTIYGIPLCNGRTFAIIELENKGTLPLQGTLRVNNNTLFEYITDEGTPSYFESDSIVWDVDSIGVNDNLYISAYFNTPDESAVGEIFEWKFVFKDDNAIVLDRDIISDIYVCSADPNDKNTRPNDYSTVNKTLIGKRLEYLIRFENIGNYAAFRVIIEDELDENLDLSSIKIIASTHSHSWSLKDADLIFTFNPINLNPGGQGAIRFSIDHKEGIPENTEIRNSANIYFDSNSPIVTNATLNTMVSTITHAEDAGYLLPFSIFPNPSSKDIIVETSEENLSYEVLNIFGQNYQRGNIASAKQRIALDLNSGMYVLVLKDKKGKTVGAKKFLIQE